MLLTLALVVFFASIIVFFSQEFIDLFKKIMAIPGALLLLPLLLATSLIYHYQQWILPALHYYQDVLNTILIYLLKIMPRYSMISYLMLVLLLTFISVVPVLLLDQLSRYRTYKRYPYPYVTSTLIWLLNIMLWFYA
jgi:hypothetical protein